MWHSIVLTVLHLTVWHRIILTVLHLTVWRSIVSLARLTSELVKCLIWCSWSLCTLYHVLLDPYYLDWLRRRVICGTFNCDVLSGVPQFYFVTSILLVGYPFVKVQVAPGSGRYVTANASVLTIRLCGNKFQGVVRSLRVLA